MSRLRVAVLGVLFSVASMATCAMPAFAARSNSYVDANLSNGIQTAVNWDTNCRAYLRSGFANSYFQSNGMGNLRYGINSGASYVTQTWMSSAARGNTVTPIGVNSTDTSVGLRINDVIFLCGPLVVRDLAGYSGGCRTNVSGREIVNDGSRWVTSSNNANDRNPNDFGGGCMYPAKAFQWSKIVSLRVMPDTTYGGSVSGGVNAELRTTRDNNSRYWFGDTVPAGGTPGVPITYRPGAGGFDRNGQIHLQMKYKKFSGYFSTNFNNATKSCEGSGPAYVVGPNFSIDRCEILTDDLWVTIRLNANYTLVPAISVTPPVLTAGNTSVTVNPSVKNTGTTATSSPVNWQITRFIVAPGRNYTTAGGYQNPCQKFNGYVNGSCRSVSSGSRNYPTGTTNMANLGDDPGSQPVGSKVCYFLSVKPFDNSINEWAHSTPDCSIFGKRPTVSVLGNDLRVGSGLALANNLTSKIQGTTMVQGGRTYGSWAEYGITAPGAISSIASGSAFAPAGGAPTSQAQWSTLTFSNTSAALGNYAPKTSVGVLPDIGKYFQLSSLPGVTKKSVGNVTLNSYDANTVYISSGTVTINSNINAPNGTIPNVNALNQMIIIAAGGIKISQNVTNIEAWLISPNGTIDTCYEQAGNLSTSICDKQLTINGPVQAKSLLLRRTFGDEKTPAESINLRSDAYLWARRESEQTGAYQTKHITDLPPRY